jgi:hypothetical protein
MHSFVRPFVVLAVLLGLFTGARAQSSDVSIVSVSVPFGTFPEGATLTIDVTFSNDITVTDGPVGGDNPLLHLTVGGVARTASYYGPYSASKTATFLYTVRAGDNGVVALQSPLDPNHAYIRSTSGPVRLDFTPPDTSHTIVDTTPPSKPAITSYDASSPTPSFHGTADAGTTVTISGPYTYPTAPTTKAAADGTWTTTWPVAPLDPGTYSFYAISTNSLGNRSQSDPVNVTVPASGPPVVAQQTDIETTYEFRRHDYPTEIHIGATNQPTSMTATGLPPQVFSSFFPSPGGHPYLAIVWSYGIFTGGKFTVSVTATNSLGTSAPMTFHWTVHPGMNDFLSTDKRSYVTGDTITFTAKFSAPVVVTGTPYIPLWGSRKALYVGGSGTSTLTFKYQIAPDDPSASGLYYSDIALGDGSIATADNVSAALHDTYYGLGTLPEFSVTATGITTPPPTTTTPSPTTTPPPPTTTTPPPASPTKTDQTITFASPVSAIVVGQPIQLGATSSAGLPITYTVLSGDATINGSVLTPTGTATLIVRAASSGSDTVNPAVTDVNFGNPRKAAQTITVSTSSGAVPAEQPITLAATSSSGLPVTYSIVSGPGAISGNTLTFTGTGNVVVRASQAGDGTYAASDTTLTFSADPADRLVNLSARVSAGPDANHTAIAGFVVVGTAPKPMLIRAVGPGLSAYGVTDAVAAPQLQLLDHNGNVIASNSGWNNDAQISATSTSLGAFALAAGSRDAALLTTLAPGLYTAKVTAPATGEVLIEVYDASATAAVPTKQLVNISSRGYVDANTPMIGGFNVSGAHSKRVLIRAVGPGLAPFGVSGALSDPTVKIYDAQSTLIARNDNWEAAQPMTGMAAPATPAEVTAADTATGAFALQTGSKDAAVVLTLTPGAYTAVVTGADGATGTALVEVYEIP